MNSKSVVLKIGISLSVAIAGFAFGRFTAKTPPSPTPVAVTPDKENMVERRQGGFRYINPLWECDNFNPSHLNSIVGIRDHLKSYIRGAFNSGKAVHISVYFRDLNQGPWIGVNENELFSPASLLKVPIMIAVLKKCEDEPMLLQKKLTYSQVIQDDVSPNILDSIITLGKSYTIEDLLTRMIACSDNQAKGMLLQYIGEELFVKVMNDLGVQIPTNANAAADFVSVKDYSSFFRILYNATYLNKPMSEKALEILTKTDFKKGIVAGIPGTWSVAHKFGERALQNSNIRQMHECGIIYCPGSPYLLCVMTRGNDFDQLSTVIADISRIIYQEINNKTP